MKNINTKKNTTQEKYQQIDFAKVSLEELRKLAKTPQKILVDYKSNTYEVNFKLCCPVKSKIGNLIYVSAEVLGGEWGEHYLIFKDYSSLENSNEIEIRIDSGCLIGMLFDEQTCDCRSDFLKFLEIINKKHNAMMVYIPSHYGRGCGQSIKNATQILMLKGMDTVSATKLFHGTSENSELDKRSFNDLAIILRAFFGKSYNSKNFLNHSNSKLKLEMLNKAGITCTNITKAEVDLSIEAKRNVEKKKMIWGR